MTQNTANKILEFFYFNKQHKSSFLHTVFLAGFDVVYIDLNAKLQPTMNVVHCVVATTCLQNWRRIHVLSESCQTLSASK